MTPIEPKLLSDERLKEIPLHASQCSSFICLDAIIKELLSHIAALELQGEQLTKRCMALENENVAFRIAGSRCSFTVDMIETIKSGLEAGLTLGDECRLNPTAYVNRIKEALALLPTKIL